MKDTKIVYRATASSEQEEGCSVIAEGASTEVRAALEAFGGWIGFILNVYELESGYEPHLVDQYVRRAHLVERTRYGHELAARATRHGDWS